VHAAIDALTFSIYGSVYRALRISIFVFWHIVQETSFNHSAEHGVHRPRRIKDSHVSPQEIFRGACSDLPNEYRFTVRKNIQYGIKRMLTMPAARA
jgi:hypothetical protein